MLSQQTSPAGAMGTADGAEFERLANAIVMVKYRNSYAIAANSFGNSKFVIKFAHNKNLKYKLRICQVYKLEASVDYLSTSGN
jgi:hypothetical protein